ncbi:glycosyltransferase [Marinobacter psychrophilus]|uniref:glycosyltransferase n=1 Tax=Marinobacter psychrophilus TaxID=330734 RepID=UPI00069D0A36|nr:glycosyltransferase family 2 protein [Marinobacter psychrophilus]
MSLDFISVIVPAHNEEKYLSQCLTSLINQDYPSDKYEIILVNNNSTDGTKKIAENFKIITIDKKTGPVGAVRNAGAARAQGSVLAFIDADCIAHGNWLTTGAGLIKNGNTVCGGGYDLRPKPFWLEKAWLLKTGNRLKTSLVDALL